MIEYVLWVSALNNGGEFPVDAFLGDPLDVDSGFQVETTSEPVDDPRVRRALALAIDREAIVGKILRGGQTPAYSVVPPLFPGYESQRFTDRETPK